MGFVYIVESESIYWLHFWHCIVLTSAVSYKVNYGVCVVEYESTYQLHFLHCIVSC